MTKFTALQNPSPWRRIAVASWRAPNDPTVYGLLQFDFTQGLAFLERLRAEGAGKITVTHLVARAAALTLRQFPEMNGIIRWGKIYLRNTVDIFLQMATREEGGRHDLSGAKIDSCDRKTIGEIARELRDKSEKIHARKDPQFTATLRLLKWIPACLLPFTLRLISFLIHDLRLHSRVLGLPEDPFGSAMVTNIGSLGSSAGFAPITPMSRVPLILCVGEIQLRPWVVDGQVVARPILEMGATFDHRFMDGAAAAQILKAFRELIESPEKIL
ncbi:MAG: 2-oxo acid dehydrogenase subunit E2 [Deltaproteobacteria bacterium]|nr:2-oxo acid dehydrogenase subunit E2 [Deltaproteobacteria bacterium]